jgi:hypothetical protein
VNNVDNTHLFSITDVDYEMFCIFKSSLNSEKNNVKLRIKRLNSLLKKCVDEDLKIDYKSQIEYFKHLTEQIDESIKLMEQSLENQNLQ